jgi:hypothetical protein
MRSENYEFTYQSCQCDFEINNAKKMSFGISHYHFIVNDPLFVLQHIKITDDISHVQLYKMM